MEEDAGVAIPELKVDGGASANDFLMQFQADLLNADVQRPECIETTALGAAYLAGLATGFYDSTEDIASNWNLNRTFQSSITGEYRSQLIKGWKRAVRCALAWADDEDYTR